MIVTNNWENTLEPIFGRMSDKDLAHVRRKEEEREALVGTIKSKLLVGKPLSAEEIDAVLDALERAE